MKITTTSSMHDQIISLYPQAKKLIDYAVERGAIPKGTIIFNHPAIPPTIITESMLASGFPSLQEAYYWYVF